MSRGNEFSELVHGNVILDNCFSPKNIAEKMRMSYDTPSSRLVDSAVFSADAICRRMFHVSDVRLPAWLPTGADFIPAKKPITTAVESDPIEDFLRHISIMMLMGASDVAHLKEKTIADQQIDHHEAVLIQKETEAAVRTFALVGEHIKKHTD